METGLIISRNSNVALSKVENAIIKAKASKRINELNAAELIDFVSMLVIEALMTLGHKNAYSNADDIEATQTIIIKNLNMYASDMRTEEVKLAVEMGVNGQFDSEDKIITFSPASMMVWIRKFKEKANKTLYKESELQRIEEEKNKEIKQKEENIKYLRWVLSCSLEYVKNNSNTWIEFDDLQFQAAFETLYNYIKEFLNLSTEDSWNILIESRKEYKENIDAFEINWRPQDYNRFCETIEVQSILKNNYFHMKTIAVAKIKMYKQAIIEIAKMENAQEIITNIQNQVL